MGHTAKRFLTTENELKGLINETLSEPIIKAAEMDREADLFIEYCAKSEAEDLDHKDDSMSDMDWNTRFPESLSGKELADEAAALELEERFYNERDREYDDRDDVDIAIALDDFFDAGIKAAKEDSRAKSMLEGIFETHISPEARAVCEQADRNNPTIKKDRQFYENVIGNAAEHAIENSGEYDHLR